MAEVSLPAPLVSEEVSLGTNEWFPLYHRRLQKSRWWRAASDLARSRNVDLWCHAFEETPAGSLPDDDLDLADAAGFGRDVAAFTALKAEIMAPWLLCSDGRWYHPALCEVVLEAWERTSERRRKDRARQAQHRAQVRQQTQGPRDASSLGVTRDEAGVSRVTGGEVTHGHALQTDRDDKQDSVASAAPLATIEGGKAKKPSEPWREDPEFLTFWEACTPKARRRSSARKAWGEWVKVRKWAEGQAVAAAYRLYLKQDPDVQRTGGPGVHVWLKDKLESWVTAAAEAAPASAWSAERWNIAVRLWRENGEWGDSMGPKPGEPACRVPQQVLAQHGLGLQVIQGGAA